MNITLLEQQKFIKNDIPSRLQQLSAHLLQIHSLSGLDAPSILQSIKDCRYWIEWTAPDLDIDRAVKLVEIQRRLSYWLFHWDEICLDDVRLQQVSRDCGELSQVVLKIL
jgi:hypothetical protein